MAIAVRSGAPPFPQGRQALPPGQAHEDRLCLIVGMVGRDDRVDPDLFRALDKESIAGLRARS